LQKMRMALFHFAPKFPR